MFAAFGVPEITPPAERPRPTGKLPLSRLHVTGAAPEAVSVWLYAVLTTPPGNDSVIMTGAAGAGRILILSARVPLPTAFSTEMVKLKTPSASGVPEIRPLVSSSAKPPGKTPSARPHISGGLPLAVRVWLYAVPTVPFANAVVVILGAEPVPLPGQDINVREKIRKRLGISKGVKEKGSF